MPSNSTIRSARGRYGAAKRHHSDDPGIIEATLRELKDAQAQDYIRRLIDEAPPLSPAQRDRLAILLLGGAA
ncbi:MAG TPA: hypothetical protein VGL75_10650 [Acidothermaceae bacterium]